MTIAEFAESANNNPLWIFIFFGFIILFTIVAGIIGKGEGHLSPWKFLYSALIYLTCVPAILIVTISIYALMFEGASIMQTSFTTQIVPVLAMVATLLIAKANVSLDRIPGFGKISGLILMIVASSVLMMMVSKMRLLIFSYMPIHQLGLIFLVIFVVIYFGWTKIMRSSN